MSDRDYLRLCAPIRVLRSFLILVLDVLWHNVYLGPQIRLKGMQYLLSKMRYRRLWDGRASRGSIAFAPGREIG
jgi:hypothetical protein